MKLIRGLCNLPKNWNNSVVTIGNFDGLHKGHQTLIKKCISLAKKHQTVSVLMTFEPYPQAYFSKDKVFPRLMNFRDKFFKLKELGIDYLFVLPFNASLSQMSADHFIRKILVQSLKVKAVVVGDDFQFGMNRAGDFNLLASFAKKNGDIYEAIQMPTLTYQEERISSSRLRFALSKGDLPLVNHLLGQPYYLSGQVVRGDQRGREFGFPTANIYVGQKRLPLSGIFIVEMMGLENKVFPGVASVGSRPMYPTEKDLLEVFLLDFDRDIYQQHVTVTFLKRLRDEMYFSSEAALIAQIKEDVAKTQSFFTL